MVSRGGSDPERGMNRHGMGFSVSEGLDGEQAGMR
jgi:hypothetical protein